MIDTHQCIDNVLTGVYLGDMTTTRTDADTVYSAAARDARSIWNLKRKMEATRLGPSWAQYPPKAIATVATLAVQASRVEARCGTAIDNGWLTLATEDAAEIKGLLKQARACARRHRPEEWTEGAE